MTVPVIITGIISVIIGAILIARRKPIAFGIAEGQKSLFGRAGKIIAKQSKPIGVVMAGSGFVLIGVAGVVMGLLISPENF